MKSVNNRLRILLLVLLNSVLAPADEGIWLVNQFPKQRVRDKHGFSVTDEWLNHLRSSAVRLNNGGSGSFVSPDGLIFTNHHVASECLQQLTTPQADLMKDGFWAPERKDEKPCHAMEINSLLAIDDVTSRVQAAAVNAASAEANQRRKAAMTEIEKECGQKHSGERCDVVTLYSGGLYHLYRYKKYTDIRLVFAPEAAIGAFGGDPDNFMFPRYCLDIAFLRAYENGQPARVPSYLRWSRTGASQGELQFVPGHPGSTGRLATQAELEYLRDNHYPFALRQVGALIDTLKNYASRGPDEKRNAGDLLFSQQNTFKAVTGFLSGLREPDLMARKRDEEQTLRAAAAADATLADARGVWDETAAAYKELGTFNRRYWLLETNAGRGSELFAQARRLLRYTQEKQKPNGERLREYVDPALPEVEQALYSTAPYVDSMEVAVLTWYLDALERELGPADPVVTAALGGRKPAEAAAEYVASTRLQDLAVRKSLAASPEATANSTDGMLRLARLIDSEGRKVRKRQEDRVDAVVAGAGAKVARVRFAKFGTDDYPDATFTLRLSYGPATSYRNAKGELVPWATDFAGAFRHATGVEPFALPPRWIQRKKAMRLKTVFNYVTTADTHGGNSGSPTVNTKGEVVGILFDGNIEGLPNRFVYRDQRERSVHVASQGIVEALRSVYNAHRLLRELGAAK